MHTPSYLAMERAGEELGGDLTQIGDRPWMCSIPGLSAPCQVGRTVAMLPL